MNGKRTYHEIDENIIEEIHYMIDSQNPEEILRSKKLNYFSGIIVTAPSLNIHKDIDIFPNPSSNKVTLQLPDIEPIRQVE